MTRGPVRKTLPIMKTNRRLKMCCEAVALLVLLPFTRAADLSEAELTTVFSTVHNGYQREKLPDGSLKQVRYAFGEGTYDPGSIADPSLEHLKFGQLAVLLSAPLAKLGYQPGPDQNTIDQLIVVHWGRTIGWDSDGYGDAYGTLNITYSTMKAAFPTPIPTNRSVVGLFSQPDCTFRGVTCFCDRRSGGVCDSLASLCLSGARPPPHH